MSFRFRGSSEIAHIPANEAVDAEAVLGLPMQSIADRVVEQVSSNCPHGCGHCGLAAKAGESDVDKSYAVTVSCARLLCGNSELVSHAAAKIREIGDFEGDIEEDTPEERRRVREEFRTRFFSSGK